jgi:hypothetical protein
MPLRSMRYSIQSLKPLILLFFLIAFSCGNETGISDSGGYGGNGITVLRIGTFSGMNSYSATGQLKILRNDTSLAGSLDSGYSGAHSFAVPEEVQTTLYKFVIIYKPSSGTNIARAQLVMPLPLDYSKIIIR